MDRVHLFEFGDLSWFPQTLRNYGTDFLQFVSNRMHIYKPIAPKLVKALKTTQTKQIIDLGSGGGGGLLQLNEELLEDLPDLKILLTDLHPNKEAFARTKALASNFDYINEPVDARDVPPDLVGLRTQFLSLHHFQPQDAQLILQNAVDARSPIAIFEAQERSIGSIIAMLLSPLSVVISTPFIRPFKWTRILFTYLIPIVPLFVLWDGVVSSLRTYSVKEMNQLINRLNGSENYTWDVGKVRSGPGVILYLIGRSKLTN